MTFNVSDAFKTFCGELRFSDDELSKIIDRYHSITRRINIDYWGSSSSDLHSLYVGSYGRDTEIFASDIDMLVQLPYSVYERFDKYIINGQSELLQDVKKTIARTYSSSTLKADGQIISIPFSDGINFEVLPAFLNTDGSYTFANSNDGGSWKTTHPRAEIAAIREMDNNCNSNLKRLCKMARAWKKKNNVDICGILIDVLSYNFISSWEYKDKSFLYYDWMSRDFFKYLSDEPMHQTRWKVMGRNRYIIWYGFFQNKAREAYDNAKKAIDFATERPIVANNIWREIYGSKFPKL